MLRHPAHLISYHDVVSYSVFQVGARIPSEPQASAERVASLPGLSRQQRCDLSSQRLSL